MMFRTDSLKMGTTKTHEKNPLQIAKLHLIKQV